MALIVHPFNWSRNRSTGYQVLPPDRKVPSMSWRSVHRPVQLAEKWSPGYSEKKPIISIFRLFLNFLLLQRFCYIPFLCAKSNCLIPLNVSYQLRERLTRTLSADTPTEYSLRLTRWLITHSVCPGAKAILRYSSTICHFCPRAVYETN